MKKEAENTYAFITKNFHYFIIPDVIKPTKKNKKGTKIQLKTTIKTGPLI